MSFPTFVGVLPSHTLAMGLPHGMEWIVIGLIALLLFGKRLPSVAKSIAQGIREFKVGVKSAESESEPDKIAETPQPRFDPHTGKPLA